MSYHAFVDESKERGFLLVAACVPAADVAAARKSLRALLMRNQRRLHFNDEGVARRRKIVDVVTAIGVEALVYSTTSDRDARERCMRALVADLARTGVSRLIVERDDSIAELDQRVLYEEVRAAGLHGTIEYHLLRAHEEMLLALPDAVAWCWAHKGYWRSVVSPFCSESSI